jgi:hypothetical protein
MAHPLVEVWRKAWPVAFPGPELDERSGNVLVWATIQNLRSRKLIDPQCFIEGKPTIILRDPFLDLRVAPWLETRRARKPVEAPRRGRRPRSATEPDLRRAAG